MLLPAFYDAVFCGWMSFLMPCSRGTHQILFFFICWLLWEGMSLHLCQLPIACTWTVTLAPYAQYGFYCIVKFIAIFWLFIITFTYFVFAAKVIHLWSRWTKMWSYLCHWKLEGKYSLEYRSLRKRNSRPSSTNHCPQAVLLLIYYRKTA